MKLLSRVEMLGEQGSRAGCSRDGDRFRRRWGSGIACCQGVDSKPGVSGDEWNHHLCFWLCDAAFSLYVEKSSYT